MSLHGKFAQYLALKKDGLNTLEVDVKDESGNVGFLKGAPALARKDGAARPYYDAKQAATQARKAGVYLIGRVVSFEDPITAVAHPELAIHRSDGSLWHTNGGLAWLNPYSRAAWKYDVDVAVAAAKAGFDEIQFDYVRFPSDGDLSIIRYPGAHPQPMKATIAAFLRTRPRGCIRSACASRPTCSACRPRTISASASTPARSGTSSTRSIR